MKYLVNNLRRIYYILFSIVVLGIILGEFHVIKPHTIIGDSMPSLFFLLFILDLIRLLLQCKEKDYTKIIKKSLRTTIYSVASLYIYVFLVKLKLLDASIGLVFAYVVFPYMILVYLISMFILFRDKKYTFIKNHFIKSFIWLLILIIGMVLHIYLKKV